MQKDRHEKRTHWVRHGEFAVAVPIEVIYPWEDPSEACYEPHTVRLLDEVAARAEAGDVEYLKTVGLVYRAIPAHA